MRDERGLAGIVLVTALVQVVVIDHARMAGVSPNLVFAVAALVGLLSGPERGALTGFLTGLVVDLASSAPLGLTALAGCLVGHAAGTWLSGVVRRSRLLPIAVAAIAGMLGTLLYLTLAALMGRTGPTLRDVLIEAILVGVADGALAPPVARLLHADDDRRPALR